ncbi:MAG: hypothetical protein QF902_11960 [Rhodospirillales bacterium]|nr:hypothetical protein [Rhodospirillales bacterium]
MAGLGALLAVGITFWRVPELAPAPLGVWILEVKHRVTPTRPSLAVLPFEGHGDRDATEFGDAISAGITSALAVASDIFVVSRSSVQTYRERPAPPQRIATDLRVRYLLEGSVSKFGDSVNIRVGLIDTQEGGRYVSIVDYQRKEADFFQVQREITLEVVTALQVRLTEGEQERIALVHGTKNFDAWLLASEGEKRLRQMAPKTNLGARHNYEQAVALDPNYVGAWIGLGWTYLLEARFGWSSDRMARLIEARRIAERAMALDEGRAAAHSLMGTIAIMTGDFSTATQLGGRSVELDYNDPDGLALLAYTLSYTGEPRRAISLVRRASRLRPYPPRWYGWLLARCHRLAGRPEETITILTSDDSKYPRSIIPLVDLAAAYGEVGARAKARAVAASIVAVYPQFSVRAWLTMPSYKDRDVAERELKTLVAAGLPE